MKGDYGLIGLVDWFDSFDRRLPDTDIICYWDRIRVGDLRKDAELLAGLKALAGAVLSSPRNGEASPDALARLRKQARDLLRTEPRL